MIVVEMINLEGAVAALVGDGGVCAAVLLPILPSLPRAPSADAEKEDMESGLLLDVVVGEGSIHFGKYCMRFRLKKEPIF